MNKSISKTPELLKALAQREKLVKRYHALEEERLAIREELRTIPGLERYRPQVELSFCECGAGPFSARDMRKHKCAK
jgi:hypothetical protein